jgi:hypothetical protein
MATRPNMRTLQMQDTIDRQAKQIRWLQGHASVVVRLLETGDNRNLASDGPAGGKSPDLSPSEWGEVYRACKAIVEAAEVER